MIDDLKTTEFLFGKIKKLYPTFSRPDEIDVRAWTEILSGYSQTDILDALKEYRKNVPYDKAPNPATFKGYLPERVHTTSTEQTEDKITYPTPTSLMDADVESGNCHHNLPTYEAAYRLVTQDWLAEILPADIYATTRFPNNIALAYNNGLFDRFDEALRIVSQKKFGADIQFLSKNDMDALKQQGKAPAQYAGEAIKTLSAHWSAL